MSQEIRDEVAEGLDEEDAWINSLKKRVNFSSGIDGPKHEEHLIYRVHSDLREGNESCYEPTITSIGPYHRGKEHLLQMETHKERYVCHLLLRNENVRFEHLVNMMKEWEQRVRRCYPGKIKLDSKAFVEMMLLDGCFIVELLLKFGYGRCGKDDLIDGPGWRLVNLCSRDMLLLENQLPFFLLQEIFQLVMPNATDPAQAFVKLSWEFLKCNGLSQTQNEQVPLMDPESVHHLLHLCHTQLIQFPAEQHQDSIPAKHSQDSKIHKLMHLVRIPADSKILKCNNYLAPCLAVCNCFKGTTHRKRLWLPGVTQLKEAGVKFKTSSSNLLDIKFCNGEMIIPMIEVFDYTETKLRNLIAFEQCCLRYSHHYFTCYVDFLDSLINTSKDVELLHKKNIPTHGFGDDEEVAQLFNKLKKGLLINWDSDYLRDIFDRVNDHSSQKIHKWRASLVRDYFYSPWALLSFIAAIVALSLTAIQTVYSVH